MLETRRTAEDSSVQRADRPSSPALAISNQLVKLFATYLGRGPTRSRATVTDDLVVVTFGEAMTRAEQHLVAAGEAEAVQSMRRIFHRSTRHQAIEIIERALQRTVKSYMADIDTHANIALLAFVLDPAAKPDNRPPTHAENRVIPAGPA
jgi:uncharacterized protein YbcI